MGVQNFKFESEVFQQIPSLQIGGGITPVETKPDPSWLHVVSSQIAQLTANVNQLTQVVAGQSFTRSAPIAANHDTATSADELRKLSQRLDDIEARLPKGQTVGAKG